MYEFNSFYTKLKRQHNKYNSESSIKKIQELLNIRDIIVMKYWCEPTKDESKSLPIPPNSPLILQWHLYKCLFCNSISIPFNVYVY